MRDPMAVRAEAFRAEVSCELSQQNGWLKMGVNISSMEGPCHRPSQPICKIGLAPLSRFLPRGSLARLVSLVLTQSFMLKVKAVTALL